MPCLAPMTTSCAYALGPHEITEDAALRDTLRDVVRRSGVGGMIETVSRDPLFEFDLEQVDVAR